MRRRVPPYTPFRGASAAVARTSPQPAGPGRVLGRFSSFLPP